MDEVRPLKETLAKAVLSYKQHKYNVLARTALKYDFSHSLTRSLNDMPKNATYDTNKETQQAFSELTLFKFLYPVLSDPMALSDALKVKALATALDKQTLNDTSSPTHEELKSAVFQIIEEESSIGWNFSKPNLVLDDLYDDIDVKNADAFVLTSGFPAHALGNLKEFCEQDNGCVPELVKAIDSLGMINTKLHKLMPIQTHELAGIVVEVLEQYNKNKDIVDELIANDHIDCDAVKCKRSSHKSSD